MTTRIIQGYLSGPSSIVDFEHRLNDLIEKPPEGYFFQEIHFTSPSDRSIVAVVIYSEIPSSQ